MNDLTKFIQEDESNIDLENKILELKNEVTKLCSLVSSFNIHKAKSIEQHNLKKKSLSETFKNFNFDIFSPVRSEGAGISPRENMLDIFSICEKFVLGFDEDNDENLLFYGPTGVGKTYMSNCILNDLIANGSHTVRCYSAVELFEVVQDSLIGKTKYDRRDYDMLFECDLLVIDNLGTEIVNKFTNSHLLAIIETRELNYKKTVISTNLTPNQIRKTYDARILSRLLGNYRLLKFIGDDLRWEIYKK